MSKTTGREVRLFASAADDQPVARLMLPVAFLPQVIVWADQIFTQSSSYAFDYSLATQYKIDLPPLKLAPRRAESAPSGVPHADRP